MNLVKIVALHHIINKVEKSDLRNIILSQLTEKKYID